MADDKEKQNKSNAENQSNNDSVESKSTNSDKVRKKTEHEAGISRGTHVTPNSNSNAGRDI